MYGSPESDRVRPLGTREALQGGQSAYPGSDYWARRCGPRTAQSGRQEQDFAAPYAEAPHTQDTQEKVLTL
jgi:hypothetical protein